MEAILNTGVKDLIDRLALGALDGFRPNENILAQAFQHPSWCVENPSDQGGNPYLDCNQRLEFLGDSILGLVCAKHLYEANPTAPEGELTRMRASLVCEKSLAAAAIAMDLGRYLRLGNGIAASGGRSQASLLADAFEALVGALHLCGVTLSALEGFVFSAFAKSRHLIPEDADEDYKGQLQAFIQRSNDRMLSYAILQETGPDHQKRFLAAAYVDQAEMGRGWGNTKQEAQKQAAKQALLRIQRQ